MTAETNDDLEREILGLTEQRSLDPKVFGEKASHINDMALLGVPRPKTFFIGKNAVFELVKKETHSVLFEKLKSYCDILLQQPFPVRLILRSSSVLEDNINQQLSGFFTSIGDIVSIDDLISGLLESYHYATSERVKKYCHEKGIKYIDNHLAVIVQAFIDFEYSGLVKASNKSILFEMYKGSLGDPISGGTVPMTYVLEPDTGSLHSLNHLQPFDKKLPALIRDNHIEQIISKLLKHYHKDILLEVGFSKGKVLVLQVREYEHQGDLYIELAESRNEFIPRATEYGLKAAAMLLFKETGLFPGYLLIIPPKTRKIESYIAEIRENLSLFSSGITVRFSYKEENSLPRFFIKTVEELSQVLLKERRLHWTTIIYPYISIYHSFELYIKKGIRLLEHIPGIWESDNKLEPDVVEINHSGTHILLWNGIRDAKLYFPENIETRGFGKVEPSWLLEVTKKALEVSGKVFQDIKIPIIIHFCIDNNGLMHFFNVRKSKMMYDVPKITSPIHLVQDVLDMHTWNGSSSLLLDISTKRGHEHNLMDLINLIPKNKNDIFITSGVLSHPAMFLRENGITTYPSYLLQPHHNNILNKYEEFRYEQPAT